MARKSIKKTTKRSVSDHSALSGALNDISRELLRLKRNKESLSKEYQKLQSDILNVQNYETRLRDRISKLVAKESKLNKSKGGSQASMLKIKEKIAKVKKIQEELRDI